MIPNHKVFEGESTGDFIYESYDTNLKFKHPGGLDLNSPTTPYFYQYWHMDYTNDIIRLYSELNEKNYELERKSNVKRVTFSFTRNMDLVYAYEVDNKIELKIYQQPSILLENKRSPYLLYDDIRENNESDICLFYIDNLTNNLCYRLLRDRFTIEYVLYENVSKDTDIVRIGMTTNYRLNFKLKTYS